MADADPAGQDTERESIWSVRKDDLAWYSVLFPLLWLLGTVYYFLSIILRHEELSDAIDMLIVKIGVVGLSSAVLSLMILAGKRGLVVPLFNWYADREAKRKQRSEQDRQQGRAEGQAEGQAEGRAEGFAEANARWESWNTRREAAKANGGEFNELPPSQQGESRDYR